MSVLIFGLRSAWTTVTLWRWRRADAAVRRWSKRAERNRVWWKHASHAIEDRMAYQMRSHVETDQEGAQ